MQRKTYLKILLGIVTLILLVKFLTTLFAEPWIRKKILTTLNEKNRDYLIDIDKVHISLIKRGIELESIILSSKQNHKDGRDLKAKIASVKFKGINIAKALFKKDIDINEVTISNSNIKGKILFSREAKPPIVLPLNIRIRRILFNKTDLSIRNISNAQSYLVKEGALKFCNLQVEKHDTLSPGIVKQFDFEAKELNPILEKNAFIYATSGKIDTMNFSFMANNTKATGKMTLLYHGSDIAVKNKKTDDTTAFRERFISSIVNIKVLDSNPLPNEEVREGIIDFERDPERFLFHYCFRSILPGIKSSLVKTKKRENS